MEYFAKSDIGNLRKQNEDYYYARDNLFIVADGMGGHNAGEVASRTAVDAFVDFFLNKNPGFSTKTYKSATDDHIKETMLSAIKYANDYTFKLASSSPDFSGMGTTFTACYILKGKKFGYKAFIVHAGDSRVYLKDKNILKILTDDQTLVGSMYKKGLITFDEMFSHPLRNYLENVLGTEEQFGADFLSALLNKENILILCTDGLNSMLEDSQIDSIISKFTEPKKITEELVSEAKKKGGLDNITVVTIKL